MPSKTRDLKIAEFSYAEAVRGLSGQERSLDSVRQRATANIAIAGVATSFLSSEVISSSNNLLANTFILLSLVLFLLSIAASVYVLVSRKGWVFHQSAKKIRELYISDHPELELDEVTFTISGHLEDSYRENQQKLDGLYVIMNLAFLLTVGHILIWTLVITLSTWSVNMSPQPQPENNPRPAQNEPSSKPQSPPDIPNPGIGEQRSDDPPRPEPVHITPAREN